MPETIFKAIIEAKTKEGIDLLKIFAEAYNKCNVGNDGAKILIINSDEFQEGIKELIIRIVASNNQTLKS